MTYVLAVDMGASGGRHILAHLEEGKIVLEEIYRFDNVMVERNGHLCWQMDRLWEHVLKGMAACKAAGKIPVSMGIDTWGVDYVLLDQAGQVLGDTVAYRDSRTQGMDAKLELTMPFTELYRRTGIAKQPFNTVYQLMATPREQLDQAQDFLMIPDYLHYRLTGRKANEYTEASTTGMLNSATRDWDQEVLAAAGIPAGIFHRPEMPGTNLGPILPEIAQRVGFSCDVVLPATHDTGSAFMAVPARSDNAVYLSSGTWSLLGVENDVPLTGIDSLESGFTNEGGYGGKIRYLKNIMGMWILQCVRNELEKRYSFGEMAQMAAEAPETPWRVDVADNRFLAPKNMIAELQLAVTEQGGEELTLPRLLRMVNLSLAEGYAKAIAQLEQLTGKRYDTVHIVGGGSQNQTLNQMTADAAGRTVVAGPTEGTALGNLMAQLIAGGVFADLAQAREAECASFDVVTYVPKA